MIDYYLLQGTQLNGLSQANVYGDDCQSATNYPLVRLHDVSSGNIYFARTYEFSTMGVATGASLQSARFKLSGIPHGTYELTVIANGISSHPLSFTYSAPSKPYFLDHGLKLEFERQGKLIYEGDPFSWREWIVDPVEIVGLRTQVKQLQNSVQRLNSLISAQQLPRVGRAIADAASMKKEKTTE
jgi:hypothetical protein